MKEILRLSLEADRSFRELAGMLGMDVDEMTRTLLAEGSDAAGEG